MSAPMWSLLQLPGARDLCRQAAKRVHRQFENYTEIEDLFQEAQILLCTHAGYAYELRREEPELGLIQHRIEQDLRNKIETDVRRARQSESFDVLTAEPTDDSPSWVSEPFVPERAIADDYNRELVDLLLPAVWDESYCYKLPSKENAPDSDMPKGTVNKAHGNNLAAYVADIKIGYDRAGLTFKEKRAVVMHYGLFWPIRDVAYHEGVSRQAVEARLFSAIGKIVARLNGGIWHELLGDREAIAA